MEEQLKQHGCRLKFPMKSGDLSRRWCSAYLKIMVADTVMSNLSRLGELEQLGGKRHKFPAKGGTHQGHWCSGNLKVAVQDSVTSNLEKTKGNVKVLVVSGDVVVNRPEEVNTMKWRYIELMLQLKPIGLSISGGRLLIIAKRMFGKCLNDTKLTLTHAIEQDGTGVAVQCVFFQRHHYLQESVRYTQKIMSF